MIPNKSNFKFQELTPITGVKPYVIRFWETEFSDIAPVTSDSGQKLYARKDVEAIFKIKKLLFDQKMSIPEARVALTHQDDDLFEEALTVEAPKKNLRLLAVRDSLRSSLELIQKIKLERKW